MLVALKGQLELGTHAVGGRYQHRVGHVGNFRAEQAPEAADIGDNALGMRAGDKMFDAAYKVVARLNVDAGFSVGFGAVCGHRYFLLAGEDNRKS